MLKIGVCFMNIGETYKQITFWSRENKISYCKKHGYDFIEDESILIKNLPIPWSKIPLLLKYIDNYDYIVWIDADILIMNLNIKIEDFISKYPNDIVVGSDYRMINTGVMIIKNSSFSKEFIKSMETNVYDPYSDPNERYQNWEQGSFINLYDKNFLSAQQFITITSPTEMNSYWYNYFPGHFVLHFAGVRGDLLKYLIRDFFPERLDSDDDNSYNSRMSWLAGPVRDHFDAKLEHDRKMDLLHRFNFRILLEKLKIFHYDNYKLIRLGNKYDGGYVIPNLPYEKLITFSYNNDISFDIDFRNKFKSNVYLFNPLITTCNEIGFTHYSNGVYNQNKNIDFNNHNFLCLEVNTIFNDIIDNSLLLKIDLEGYEYDVVAKMDEENLKKIMVIVGEFHWLGTEETLQKKIECFEKLNKYFYPIHIHANNHSPLLQRDNFYFIPDVAEITYLRKDLYDGKDIRITDKKFPTVLDFPNHGGIPDINFSFYPFCKYYFSLTTIPSRFEKLNDVIYSLVNQNIKPDKIFINIPKEYKRFKGDYMIPESIYKYDNVVINYVDYDYGSATKFLPLMLMDGIDDDTPIIIVDDDLTYDFYLSSHLLKDSVRFPDSCITSFGITHSSYMFDNQNWICDYNSQNKFPVGFREKNEGYVDAFEGFKGTLLKKKFFKDDVFDFTNEEFMFADNVWFSGHIIKNGYTIFISKFSNKSKFIQNDIDALSSDKQVRDKRMYDCAMYFHKTFDIWKTHF